MFVLSRFVMFYRVLLCSIVFCLCYSFLPCSCTFRVIDNLIVIGTKMELPLSMFSEGRK